MKNKGKSQNHGGNSSVPMGYKKTEVGVIPEDWEVALVGSAFEICNNLRMPISQSVREKIAGPFPYYGPTSIQGFINEYRIEGEYALIGEDGDHFLKWENQPMTQLVSGRFNVNNHAHLIKGSKNLTSWFYYYFFNRDITPFLTRQGAGRYKLTKSTLIEIPCAIPPTKAEQEAIAGALSDADALIESLEQLIAKKRHIKQGAMQELLTGKKRLPGFQIKPGYKKTEVGLIPEDWEAATIGTCCSCFSGGTPSTSNLSYFGGNIPWINSGDLNKVRITEVAGRITEEGLVNSAAKMVNKGTLLLALYGATAGVSAIIEIQAAINQAVLAIIPNRLNNEYLFQFLRLQKDNFIKTYTQGGQPNFSGEIVKSFLVSLPSSKQEQTAIATILSDMDAEITTLESKLTKTRSLKQGMMHNLLTGKIRLVKPEKSKMDIEA